MSTGRSIHAVPSITPSPGEGIQDLPSRPQAGSGAGPVRWPHPTLTMMLPVGGRFAGRSVDPAADPQNGTSEGPAAASPPPVTRRRDRQDD